MFSKEELEILQSCLKSDIISQEKQLQEINDIRFEMHLIDTINLKHKIDKTLNNDKRFIIKLDDGTYFKRIMTYRDNGRNYYSIDVTHKPKDARYFNSKLDKEYIHATFLINSGYTLSDEYRIVELT